MNKMQKEYKDIDSLFRTMLGDAEEEVPSYLSDRVFGQLDLRSGKQGGKRPVPAWWRWAAPVVAVAAALLLAVLLWPEQEVRPVNVSDVTAMVEPQKSHTVVEPAEPGLAVMSGNPVPEAKFTRLVPGTEKVTEPVMAGPEDNVPEDRQEQIAENSADEDQTGNRTEEHAAAEVEEEVDIRQASVEDFPEGRWDGPSDDDIKEGNSYERVSLEFGGDVSGNGNAKGIGRFGGFRAPAMGVRNDTWIEQTGTESSYAIPVSFGLGVKVALAKRWSLGTGVNYTLLQRTFSGVYTKVQDGETVTKLSSDVRNSIHYIGIPLNVYYDIVSGNHFRLYAYGGGTFEKGVKNSFRVKNAPEDIFLSEKVKGVQLSAGAGLGVEFIVSKRFGIYLDPGFRYYFDCDQPVSIRTQQPFTMNFELGFRVDI